jgi:hypothetical protein
LNKHGDAPTFPLEPLQINLEYNVEKMDIALGLAGEPGGEPGIVGDHADVRATSIDEKESNCRTKHPSTYAIENN